MPYNRDVAGHGARPGGAQPPGKDTSVTQAESRANGVGVVGGLPDTVVGLIGQVAKPIEESSVTLGKQKMDEGGNKDNKGVDDDVVVLGDRIEAGE